MPDTENPRSYIRPVPLPIPSHQGLKITARNAKFYTCEVPTRKEVARENYERRRHQMSKCGYRSVIYKPYQPVGEVFLDDRKLILSALGQEQTEQDNQVYCDVEHSNIQDKVYPLRFIFQDENEMIFIHFIIQYT